MYSENHQLHLAKSLYNKAEEEIRINFRNVWIYADIQYLLIIVI